MDYQGLEILDDVSIEDQSVRNLDKLGHVLRGKLILLVKVHWTHYGIEEAT